MRVKSEIDESLPILRLERILHLWREFHRVTCTGSGRQLGQGKNGHGAVQLDAAGRVSGGKRRGEWVGR